MTSTDFLIPVSACTYILVYEGDDDVKPHIVDTYECMGAQAAFQHWAPQIAENPYLKVYIKCGGQS